MKCIILAAGYATRMAPLTDDTPKSFLPIAGVPLLDYVMEKVEEVEQIDKVYLAANAKFYGQFAEWLADGNWALPVELINDGSTANENRLGALGDLRLVLREKQVDDDVMVLAGDNLFEFSLCDFVRFFCEKGGDAAVTIYRLPELEKRQRTGIAEVDGNWRVIGFEEKPEAPKSEFAAPAFYIYARRVLPRIREYLDHENKADAPGNLLSWLYSRAVLYGFLFTEKRYDIGDLDTYYEVDRIYRERGTEEG